MENGEERSVSPELVMLSAGAVQSAVLLLRSTTDRYPQGPRQRAPTRSAATS